MKMKLYMNNICHLKIRLIQIVAIFILLSLTSCGNGYEQFFKQESKEVFGNKLQNYSRIILIPGIGCTGCISSAEKYFQKNVNDSSCLYIFTNYISFKGLGLRLGGKENLSRQNVYLDSNNVFMPSCFNESSYPLQISLENGKVKTIKKL